MVPPSKLYEYKFSANNVEGYRVQSTSFDYTYIVCNWIDEVELTV